MLSENIAIMIRRAESLRYTDIRWHCLHLTVAVKRAYMTAYLCISGSTSLSRIVVLCMSLAHMNFEYKIPVTPTTNIYNRREITQSVYLGLSTCTYEQIVEYGNTWRDYALCSHNCQDFARGLGRYLTGNCEYPRSE